MSLPRSNKVANGKFCPATRIDLIVPCINVMLDHHFVRSSFTCIHAEGITGETEGPSNYGIQPLLCTYWLDNTTLNV